MAPSRIDWPFPLNEICWRWKIRNSLVVAGVTAWGKLIAMMNSFHVHNRSTLEDLVLRRPPGKPLLTVMNHHSCLDDPVLWSGVLKWRNIRKPTVYRWTLAAEEFCFYKMIYRFFFSSGQCIPIVRGDGVYQKSMDFCLKKLNQGVWLNFFPEGYIHESSIPRRLKWGIGRLIAEARTQPTILPIWHIGMADLLPNRSPYIPRAGKKITVLVGNPLNFETILEQLKREKKYSREVRKAITDMVQQEMQRLRKEAEKLHQASKMQSSSLTSRS